VANLEVPLSTGRACQRRREWTWRRSWRSCCSWSWSKRSSL